MGCQPPEAWGWNLRGSRAGCGAASQHLHGERLVALEFMQLPV